MIDGTSIARVGASLLAIKSATSQRGLPAKTRRSFGSNRKQGLLAAALQYVLNYARPQTESWP